jgi:hypothetical protein
VAFYQFLYAGRSSVRERLLVRVSATNGELAKDGTGIGVKAARVRPTLFSYALLNDLCTHLYCSMSASTTLMALKAQGEARDAEEKRKGERRRNLTVLVLNFLFDMGYTSAAAALQQEAGTVVGKVRCSVVMLVDEAGA